MQRLLLPIWLVAFVVGGLCDTVQAGYGGMRSGGSGGGRSSARPAPPPPQPPVDRSASTAARQDVRTVTAAADKAEAALATLTAQLRKQRLEPTDEWRQAHDALTAAQSKYDAERAAVMKGLQADPGYKSALADRATVQSEHEALRSDTPIVERARIAKAILAAADAITAMETVATTRSEPLNNARAELDAATGKMNQIISAFDATLASNPVWEATARTAKDRRQNLADAKQALADALAREAQAARDRQKPMASSR